MLSCLPASPCSLLLLLLLAAHSASPTLQSDASTTTSDVLQIRDVFKPQADPPAIGILPASQQSHLYIISSHFT
ncbi:hypothetical protein ASPFODRAFT_47323 [Aspergillus luchuensis CBS 106.47]|uniref:Uncharacterized protein n=1 Tax=Aspergillus luchuensis (strain CBS 106.47) TaxID=1137211 RepID=A0A1M3THH8_ASPLC|nr:hypothetical protein ASPFODRAFT_47323 [Aspergillus luchuensis CBS 106.47]